MAGSLSFIVTNGHSLPVPDMDYWLLNGGTMVPGVPNYVLYCLVLLVVIEFFLKKMVAGRWVYAIGSSSGAARLLGVPVRAIRFSVYVVSGLLAAFASILSISYIGNSEATAGSSLSHAAGNCRGRHRRRQSFWRHGVRDWCAAGRIDDHHHPERRESYRRQ